MDDEEQIELFPKSSSAVHVSPLEKEQGKGRRTSEEEKKDTQFPKVGIQVKYVVDIFVKLLSERGVEIKGLQTRQIRQEIIQITLEEGKCSFCEMLIKQQQQKQQGGGGGGLGTGGEEQYSSYVSAHPVAFISHAHDLMFEDLLSALEWHFRYEPEAYVWFDIFCINQHQPMDWTFEWLSTTFKGNVSNIGRTVMVMTPWNNPLPYTRSWCIFEAFSTIQTGGKFEMAMAKNDETVFLNDIREREEGSINQILTTISSERSQCFTPSDQESIFEVIRADVGFLALDAMVFEKYREWVVDVADRALQACNDEKDRLRLIVTMGVLYGGQGRHKEAINYKRQALEASKTIYGEDHEHTLNAMNNLANSIGDQGYSTGNKGLYAESEQLYRGVLEKTPQFIIGNDHDSNSTPALLDAVRGLANALFAQSRYDEAEQLYRDCVKKTGAILGDNHANTLDAMRGLANSLDGRGRYVEAIELYQEILNKQKTVLGDDHPHALGTMNGLAGLLEKQGQYYKAEQIYQDCLQKRKAIIGEDHPYTVRTGKNLERCRDKISNLSK